MLSENEMFDFIKKIAEQNERIRAVILNGSRACKSVKKVRFQDFDVVYLTSDLLKDFGNAFAIVGGVVDDGYLGEAQFTVHESGIGGTLKRLFATPRLYTY